MNKTISLEEFLDQLEKADAIVLCGYLTFYFGHIKEMQYFTIDRNGEEIKFLYVDNKDVQVYSKPNGSFSFANIIGPEGRTYDVSLLTYVQL